MIFNKLKEPLEVLILSNFGNQDKINDYSLIALTKLNIKTNEIVKKYSSKNVLVNKNKKLSFFKVSHDKNQKIIAKIIFMHETYNLYSPYLKHLYIVKGVLYIL